MTSGILQGGALWSTAALAAEWKGVEDDVHQELCLLAVEEFEDRAENEGVSLLWIPTMASVVAYGDVDPDYCLDTLWEQVIADVWQAIDGNGGPLDEQVQDILGDSERSNGDV